MNNGMLALYIWNLFLFFFFFDLVMFCFVFCFVFVFVFIYWFMIINATVNNISVISWRSVLLVEETEKTTVSQVTIIKNQIMLYRVPLAMNEVRAHLVVIGADCTCSWKSNYHTITTTTILSEKYMIDCLMLITVYWTPYWHCKLMNGN